MKIKNWLELIAITRIKIKILKNINYVLLHNILSTKIELV
jgi:hypothetical protein